MPRPPKHILDKDDELHRQGLRQCRSCDQVLPVSSFHKQRTHRHKLRVSCKDCVTEANRSYDYGARENDELLAWGNALHQAGIRVCRLCAHQGPLWDFFTHPGFRHGYDSRCKSCVIGARFGITGPEHRNMPKICSICCTSEDLVIDHCHDTGKVRGKLCRKCNSGIGLLKDDPNLLLRARAYLLSCT